jgi:hypothetical protein
MSADVGHIGPRIKTFFRAAEKKRAMSRAS